MTVGIRPEFLSRTERKLGPLSISVPLFRLLSKLPRSDIRKRRFPCSPLMMFRLTRPDTTAADQRDATTEPSTLPTQKPVSSTETASWENPNHECGLSYSRCSHDAYPPKIFGEKRGVLGPHHRRHPHSHTILTTTNTARHHQTITPPPASDLHHRRRHGNGHSSLSFCTAGEQTARVRLPAFPVSSLTGAMTWVRKASPFLH